MAVKTTDQQLVWVVIAIIAALVILFAFPMSFGLIDLRPFMSDFLGNNMGGEGGALGWTLVDRVGMLFLLFTVIIRAVYPEFRALAKQNCTTDNTIDANWIVYESGDLREGEFELCRPRFEPYAYAS